jgi:hypothetical protein
VWVGQGVFRGYKKKKEKEMELGIGFKIKQTSKQDVQLPQ